MAVHRVEDMVETQNNSHHYLVILALLHPMSALELVVEEGIGGRCRQEASNYRFH